MALHTSIDASGNQPQSTPSVRWWLAQLSFQFMYRADVPLRAAHFAPAPRSSSTGCSSDVDVGVGVGDAGVGVGVGNVGVGVGVVWGFLLRLMLIWRFAGGAFGEIFSQAVSVCVPGVMV